MSDNNSKAGDPPSDSEAAHAPDGGAVRDPDNQATTREDPNHGRLDGHPSKDPIAEYGDRTGRPSETEVPPET